MSATGETLLGVKRDAALFAYLLDEHGAPDRTSDLAHSSDGSASATATWVGDQVVVAGSFRATLEADGVSYEAAGSWDMFFMVLAP